MSVAKECNVAEKCGIAVGGSILVDEINKIAAYPLIGTLEKIEETERATGGLVPNVGVDIRHIAPEIPVYAYGKIGKDEKGCYALSRLNESGIDTKNVVVSEKFGTSFTQVMSVVGGERTFFSYAGACDDFGVGDIDFNSVCVKLFHLGYFLLMKKVDLGEGVKILKQLRDRGVETSIDLVSATAKEEKLQNIRECLPYTDDLIINELEAAAITKIADTGDLRALSGALKALGVTRRVIIHKADKCCYFDGETYVEKRSAVVPKEQIKGKTGAGDAFCAGCLCEIYRGSSAEEILSVAIAAATASLTEANATDGVKTKSENAKLAQKYIR